jgi:hypothetical protein
MRNFLLALSVSTVISASVHADDERVLARSLLNWLNSGSDANAGAAYIYGVVDAVKAQRKSAHQPDVICLPSSMEEAQMADIVRRHLLQNPARLQEPASTFVIEALTGALPCSKKS